jgi:hypothetical protein
MLLTARIMREEVFALTSLVVSLKEEMQVVREPEAFKEVPLVAETVHPPLCL